MALGVHDLAREGGPAQVDLRGPLGRGAQVLDLGCGVGGMLGPLGEWGRTIGMDVDRGALSWCRGREYHRVFESRGHRLPLADESVRMLGAFDVLEHIPEEMEALAECYRVLEPGGWFFLSGPAYQFLYTHQDRMVHHQRRYTVGDLKKKLRSTGFEVVKASYINFFLFPLTFTAVMLKKVREKISPPKDDETRFNTAVPMPGLLNRMFGGIFASERFILRVVNAPVGHSLIVLARKPENSA